MRGSSDNPLPAVLVHRLAAFPVFAGMAAAALEALLAAGAWFSLPGGAVLMREGEDGAAIYVVVNGCLGVYVPNAEDVPSLIAHVPAGETVGEMAALSGEPHSAQIVALRDTELLRLPKTELERVLDHEPALARNLMRLLIDRLRRTTRKSVQVVHPKTFALVPLQEGLSLTGLTRDLRAALAEMGLSVGLANPSALGQTSEWFNRFENAHDLVLYEGDDPDGPWTQLCIRQADRVVLVARTGRPISHARRGPVHAPAWNGTQEIVLLHGESEVHLVPESLPQARLRHLVRAGRRADAERLARLLTGRAVGLVLAGGGARGFAHIGVVRAMREAGMPIDLVGGASMGAVVAAGLALEWSDEELTARMRRAFVASDPLSDLTLPLLSLFRGRRVAQLLRDNFGDRRIEDTPIRYFCMTSDLTGGTAKAHRAGPLWRALQASVAIPGLLPPVVFDGHLHVDGGIMNNLPIDVMAEMARGPVVGVDVAGDARLEVPEDYADAPMGVSWRRLRAGGPGLVHILMRTGTVGNEFHRQAARKQADLLLEPPLEGIGLRDWHKFDAALDEGYDYARRTIETQGLPTGKSLYDRIVAG